jgi:hypothetical protein
MSIRLREKDILFIGINLIFSLCAVGYILMSILAMQALGMAEGTSNFTGFVVLITFAQVVFDVAAILVILYVSWWCWKFVKESYRQYRRDNL